MSTEVVFIPTAHLSIVGYIDPGTGSMLLQVLLGGLAGLWMVLKLFGHRIKSFFGIRTKEEDKQN